MTKRSKTVTRLLWKMSLPVLVIVGSLAFGPSCNQGAEGDRCNPNLPANESDCNSGLTCQKSPTCAENYCCPTPQSSSSNPFCNGMACATPDGGDVTDPP
jgi:hypothetical protein